MISASQIEFYKQDGFLILPQLFSPEEIAGEIKKHIPEFTINYQPDYRPIRVVDQDIRKNKAKYALVDAATKTSVDANISEMREHLGQLDSALKNPQLRKSLTDLTEEVIRAVALPLGMLLGWALMRGLVQMIRSDQFLFPAVIEPRTYAWAALCVGIVVMLAVDLFLHRDRSAEAYEVLKRKYFMDDVYQWAIDHVDAVTAMGRAGRARIERDAGSPIV